MADVVPAILEQTKEGFTEKVSLVTKISGIERIQVDFGDGEFIADRLLQADEMDTLNPAFHWEAHLMVRNPSDFLDYQLCGFKTLIVHYEAFASADDFRLSLSKIKSMGFRTGVAINPETKVDVLKEITADQYLVMSVVPGKQGQSFIETTPQKVKQLRELLSHAIIEVDGGVNETNIKSLKEAGADLICVGSALVKAPDISQAYEKLREQIT